MKTLLIKFQMRNILDTYKLAELKKAVIQMKADKFAVTAMKRKQVIALIINY